MGAEAGEHLGSWAALVGFAMIGVVAGDALGAQPVFQDRVLSLQRTQTGTHDLALRGIGARIDLVLHHLRQFGGQGDVE
jgi:hypothetical protein